MANSMFEQHGMTVDTFMAQRLDYFIRMRNAEEPDEITFIDEI